MTVAVLKRMQPADANAAGSVHGGVILRLCDEAAGIVASRHARGAVVTAGVDDVAFREPVQVGDLVHIDGEIVETGESSITVAVRVEAEDPLTGDTRHTHDARFTMVAVGGDGKPVAV